MKVSDIYGQILHLQRRRRNAGRPYRRHKTIQRVWFHHYIFKNKLNYGSILDVILKEDNTDET